jgi:hypothetical protein
MSFKEGGMKRLIIARIIAFFAALALAGLTACVQEEPITGSAEANVFSGAVFTITEKTLSGGTRMTARGTVKNTGKVGWSPIWIVEGQFYADSTFTYKLGGANKSFSYSLAKGETTAWELHFTSDAFDLSDYPNFAVRNLRVLQQ